MKSGMKLDANYPQMAQILGCYENRRKCALLTLRVPQRDQGGQAAALRNAIRTMCRMFFSGGGAPPVMCEKIFNREGMKERRN